MQDVLKKGGSTKKKSEMIKKLATKAVKAEKGLLSMTKIKKIGTEIKMKIRDQLKAKQEIAQVNDNLKSQVVGLV